MEKHGLMARYPRDTGHHSWASRDYEDVDCKAVGCLFNLQEKCSVPSRCKINSEGRCEGFMARPTPKKIDGD
jgi:hypothetical protein